MARASAEEDSELQLHRNRSHSFSTLQQQCTFVQNNAPGEQDNLQRVAGTAHCKPGAALQRKHAIDAQQ